VLGTLTDAEVLTSSVDDPRQFALIFDRYFPAVHRYVARRLGPNLADDLAQETFAIAFERRSTFDPSHESARPWLFGIAGNLLRHYGRTERRQLLAYARTGVDRASDPGFEAAEDRVDAQALGPALARALASLGRRDREVLLLHAWAGLSYEEIARALEVPVGTVRSRLFRARRRIRKRLGEIGQVVDGER
jgi:RNA polymerase sigma factor (sigma-70 family)